MEKRGKMALNFAYKTFETIFGQMIQMIIQIILARILMPKDYGTVAIASMLIGILGSVIQSSFNIALVQKKELTQTDQSSAFYVMMILAASVYAVLYAGAPLCARLYKNPELVRVIRMLGVYLIAGVWVSIQSALVNRRMQFRLSFIAHLTGILMQGVVGIFLAYHGFGVWSLVFAQLANQLGVIFIFSLVIRWRPRLQFSMESIRAIWKIGLPLWGAEFINIATTNAYPLIIGGVYGDVNLGLYQKGSSIPTTIVDGAVMASNTVFLPMMSRLQDDQERLKEMLRKGMRVSTYLIVPVAFGALAIAKDFVIVVLGEKWAESVKYMQIACVMLSLYPFRLKLQAIKAIGKAKQSFWINTTRCLITFAMLLIVIRVSMLVAISVFIFSEILYVILTTITVRRVFGYSFVSQIKDVLPAYVASVIMCLSILTLSLVFKEMTLAALSIKAVAGVVIYTILSLGIKPLPVREILSFRL